MAEANPGAAFLAGFQVGDNSQLAWQRQRMAEAEQIRAIGEKAVARAKEKKAQDFNQMIEMLSVGQRDRQENRLQRGQDQQYELGLRSADLSAYNADTSRYSAATSRYNQIVDTRRMDQQQQAASDPYGLMPPTDQPALPSLDIPTIPEPGNDRSFTFGGRTYGSNWGPTVATVFGGSRDPADNGLSAFGGRTGPGGREGVAVPEAILRQTLGNDRKMWEGAPVEIELADGRKIVQPVADLGTAERIWRKNGGPTLDLTPGAAEALGGRVIYDSRGNMTGVGGVQIRNVRVLTPRAGEVPDLPPPPAAPTGMELPDPSPFPTAPVAASPPDLSAPESPLPWQSAAQAPMIAPSALQAPTPPASSPASDSLLPPPQLQVPSFAGNDLAAPLEGQASLLGETKTALTLQAAQAKAEAQRLQAAIASPGMRYNPAARQVYREKATQLNQLSQQSMLEAAKADAAAKSLAADAVVVRKRMDDVSSLAVLDGVLPNAEVQALVAATQDPTKGGLVDEQIKTLKEYNEVRNKRDLAYPSNGYPTAKRVTLLGKRMDEAKDDMKSFDKLQSLQSDLAAVGDNFKEKPKIEAKIREARPGAERWRKLKSEFDAAVQADMRVDPNAIPAPSPPVETPADPPRAPETSGMSQPELQQWSAAKSELGNVLGGKERVKKLIAGGMDLNGFKKVVIQQLRNMDPEGGEDFPSPMQGRPLPKNASSLDDVAYALAEDLWRETGRKADEKTVPQSESISPPVRGLLQKILSQKDSPAAK